MRPLLRWSGSKSKLVPTLLSLRPVHFKRYFEPFAGSASLFFSLKPVDAVLSDINPEVIAVYRATKRDPDEVNRLIRSIPLTRAAFLELRCIDPVKLTEAERAARLIFLMKACFNGVYRTNRTGQFNVPMGSKIYSLPTHQDLMAAQRVMMGTSFVVGDFADALDEARPGDWVYMDPPYQRPGRYRGEYGYGAKFKESDLVRLCGIAGALASRGTSVMISYPAGLGLEGLLPDWRVSRVEPRRTVAGSKQFRSVEQELIATSY